MAQVHGVSTFTQVPLDQGWEVARAEPGSAAPRAGWVPAPVPGTVAAALRRAGAWDLGAAHPFDECDWWYRCRFPASLSPCSVLRLDGLATVADVWLNSVHLLRSDNMFLAHALDVSALLREDNDLCVRFHALAPLLQLRRPRPRWRTKLVEQQQLRWFRTTLLGRMPGWCPPVAPVGPWRPIVLEQRREVAAVAVDLTLGAELGLARVAVRVQPLGEGRPQGGELRVGDGRVRLECQEDGDGWFRLCGELHLRDAAPWWPHTHGAQPLYPAQALVQTSRDDVTLDLGLIGFRRLELDTGDGTDFGLRVNDVPLFCRGACWTPLDIVSLGAAPADYQQALEMARAAGMNMLRLPGNMIYEAPAFYDLCDRLGILVWQEFMFANMDYPSDDSVFVESVRLEVGQLLGSLQHSPSLAVLCGGSEVEQQAAMLGLPRDTWSGPLFQQVLPALCAELRPDVPYWPSSPSGGELPFQVNVGVAHYYGVGAYLRPLEDARRSEVRFAAECLAFANVPEDGTLDASFTGTTSVVHHPRWKSRVPRDPGAGWDFEDVRDHYLRSLFGVDPMRLRYSDTPRYLLLSRVVTGEVMASALAEWRRGRSPCHGALVWLYRDLWPGAGWGLVDALGTPKAAYYYLRRICKPLCLFITDEGLNGLYIHVVNEEAAPRDLRLRVALYRHAADQIAGGETALYVPARGAVEVPMSRLFTGFLDTSYAYRFGPPSHDLVVASLVGPPDGGVLDTAFFFPLGLPATQHMELGLTAAAQPSRDGNCTLTVRTQRFAQAVVIDAPGFLADDNYFHLEPGGERSIVLHPKRPESALRGTVTAVNSAAAPLSLVLR